MDAGLDLVKLRTLVEVRETGSMTAAAAALGYTTGAVSQQMAALERSVRVELFTQVGRRLQLTDRVERTMVLAHRREPAPQPGVRAVIDAIRQSVTPGRAG
jgi:molybdenum-dependent DNA-binding transcriptional regulator ModE